MILLTVKRERQLTPFPKFLFLSHSIKNRQTCIHCLTASINTSGVLRHPHDHGQLGNELFPQQLQAAALSHPGFSPSAGRKVERSRSEAKAENPRNSNAPQRETSQSLGQERGILLLTYSALWVSKSTPWTSSSSPTSVAGPGLFSGPISWVSCFFLSTTSSSCLTISSLGRCCWWSCSVIQGELSLLQHERRTWNCVLDPNIQVQGLVQSRPALQLDQRPRLLAPSSSDFPASFPDVPAFIAAPPVLTGAGSWMVSSISWKEASLSLVHPSPQHLGQLCGSHFLFLRIVPSCFHGNLCSKSLILCF